MREGQPKSFEGKKGQHLDGPLPEDYLEMKNAYIGRIKKTMKEGHADWGGYDKLVRLANTNESERDTADRAAQDFPGWKREDFAWLVSVIDADTRYQELLNERNQSRKQSLDGGRGAQPKSFEGKKGQHIDGPLSEADLKMKEAYIGRIERTMKEGRADWGGYDKLVRLANTNESEWDAADRAQQDFPGWTSEDFVQLVKAIHSDPVFQKLLNERDGSPKRSPIFSPEDLRRERKELSDKYNALLQNYHDTVLNLRLARKKGRIDTDPELKAEMEATDHERHEIHLELLDIAKRFGRNADHVLVDIVRMEGSLASYGLPEFSLLVSEDVADATPSFDTQGEEWRFNVDAEAGKVLAPHSIDEVKKTPLPRDHVVIVFGIASIFGDDETGRAEFSEDAEQGSDFFIREQRAKDLAKQIHGAYFDHSDSNYFHSQTMAVVGVEIPRADLEHAAKVIRDNPTKYRLGEKYYSAAEKAQIEKRQGSYNDDDGDNEV